MNADGSGLRRLTRNRGRRSTHQSAGLVTGRADDLLRALPRQHRRERSAEAPVHTVDRRLVARRAAGSPSWATSEYRAPGAWCVLRRKADSDIYVMNADGSGTRRLTHNAGYDAEPAWSPDGRKIAFQSKTSSSDVAGQQQGDLRHERRRKRKAEPHPEPGAGRSVLPGRRTGGGSRSSATATGVSKLTS